MKAARIDCSAVVIVLMLLVSVLSSGCSEAAEASSLLITDIHDPDHISPSLSQKWVRFSKNVDDQTFIHVTDLDREHQETLKLFREGNFIMLSPDHRYLVYSSGEIISGEYRSGIYVHDIDNQEEWKIAGWPKAFSEVNVRTPSFFPTGDKVIFLATWFDTSLYNLVITDLEGKHQKVITEDQKLNRAPIVSPDSSKILTMCGGVDLDSGKPGFQICIMDSDGSNQELLTQNGDSHGSYTFTPDSQRVVYMESDHFDFFDIFQKPYQRIFSVNTDGSDRRMLLDFDGAIKGISEDGGDIILEGRPTEDHPYSIYILGIDDTNLRHLTYFDDFLADWYPEDEE